MVSWWLACLGGLMRACLAVLGLVWPTIALAEETDPTVGVADVHRHVGAFIHLELGGGYFQAAPGGPGTFSGATVSFGLSAGGALSENWILAAELWGTIAPDAGISGAPDLKARLGLAFLGAGLRHYFMPINIFVALAPGATVLSRHDDLSGSHSRFGWGLKLSAGKEWWVSESWAVGLAAYGVVSFNEDPPQQNTPDAGGGLGPPTTWVSVGAGVVVTLSYH